MQLEQLQTKKKDKSTLILKVTVIILIPLMLWSVIENVFTGRITPNKKYFDNIDRLNNYTVLENKSGVIKSGEVKEFDLTKYRLPYYNLGTPNSPDGICYGFSVFEKLNFENKLKDLDIKASGNKIKFDSRLDLSKYTLTDTEYASMKNTNVVQSLFANLRQKTKTTAQRAYRGEMTPEEVYSFSNLNIDQTKKNIYTAINYFKVVGDNVNTYCYTLPYKSSDMAQFFNIAFGRKLFGKDSVSYKLNPKDITNQIDNQKVVVLALMRSSGGHAVLAYKYEYVTDNILKIYVSDSNLPLNYKNEFIKDNAEIINSSYVLFEKQGNTWQYSYNPKINNMTFYDYMFNSLIPGNHIAFSK